MTPDLVRTVVSTPAPATAPPSRWDTEQLEIIRNSVAPECSDAELAYFAQVCSHRGLDPFAGEICAVMRWNGKLRRKVMTVQETVVGLVAIAQRSGLYAGADPPQWCGPDGVWREVWLEDKPPAAARVAVYRKDWTRPAVGITTYAEFVQLGEDGRPVGLWRSHPSVMLAKTSARQAFIRAFSAHMAEAGVSTAELTGPSRISMEARQVGLDADGRHELVSRVTDGRTCSTRELEDPEILGVRAEIAQMRAEAVAQGPPENVDPETGEVSAPAAATVVAVGPDHQSQRVAVSAPAQLRAHSDWGDPEWRRFLEIAGLRVADALRKASDLAPEYNRPAPLTLAALVRMPELARAVRTWAEEQMPF